MMADPVQDELDAVRGQYKSHVATLTAAVRGLEQQVAGAAETIEAMTDQMDVLHKERDHLLTVVHSLEDFLLACARADRAGREPRTDPEAKAAHAVLTALLADLLYPRPGQSC